MSVCPSICMFVCPSVCVGWNDIHIRETKFHKSREITLSNGKLVKTLFTEKEIFQHFSNVKHFLQVPDVVFS